MAVSRCHPHHYIVVALSFLLFVSAASAITVSQLGSGFQEREGNEKGSGSWVMGRFLARRLLAGSGSSPPTCISKCGDCTPCQPILVPIDPGSSIPLQYYPEAWRCKCGDETFDP